MKLLKKERIIKENYYLYFDNGAKALVYEFDGNIYLNSVKKDNRTYFNEKFKVVKEVIEWLNQYTEFYYNFTRKVFVANEAIMDFLHE